MIKERKKRFCTGEMACVARILTRAFMMAKKNEAQNMKIMPSERFCKLAPVWKLFDCGKVGGLYLFRIKRNPPPPTSSKGNMKTQEMGVMEERIFVLRFLTKGFVFDNAMATTLFFITLLLFLLFVFIVFFNKAL